MTTGTFATRRQRMLLIALAIALLLLLGFGQSRHIGRPAPPLAFADASSTSFSPSVISLSAGGAATVTITTAGVDAGVNGAQFNIQHPSNFTVSSPQCAGIFSGGTPTGPSAVAGGDLIGCFLLSGSISGATGNSMTFALTMTSAGSSTTSTLITFGVGGGFGTQYSSGGSSVGPGSTGTLTVVPCCTLSGKTTLQFRSSTTGPTGPIVKITVASTDGSVTKTVLASDDGSWTTSAPSGLSYTVKAEAFSYLTAQSSSFTLTADKSLPATVLKVGDINGDGFVNINDVTGVVGNFGKAAPQPYPTS